MNTWILDTAIARLLSTNALVLTEPPHSQTVDQPELSRNGFETTSLQMNDHTDRGAGGRQVWHI